MQKQEVINSNEVKFINDMAAEDKRPKWMRKKYRAQRRNEWRDGGLKFPWACSVETKSRPYKSRGKDYSKPKEVLTFNTGG